MGKGGQDEGHRNFSACGGGGGVSFPAWARGVSECLDEFKVNPDHGLSSDEVQRRLQIHGPNELEKHEGPSIWSLIVDQFNDTLVRILLVAAVVSFVLAWYDGDEGGEMGITAFVEPLVIFLILIVNAIVGVWQESNAEKALEALKEIQSEHAMVKRDGELVPNLPAKELGSLTGESVAVNKTHRKVGMDDVEIQGKECMVFAGTTVVNGSCVCLVTQTGMNTEIGKVHSQIHEASQNEEDTPLKKKLNEFGEVLTMIIGVICALVWLINVKYFFTWDYVDGWPANFKFSFEKCTYYFEIAVALAVAAIPEGLPAVITTCLALGTRKMAQKNALVRKLPSVETLGCTTVICSDKTGTLTTNQMSAARLVAMGARAGGEIRSFKVEGTTYDPRDGRILDWPTGHMDENLQMIAKIAAICNDSSIAQSGHHFIANGMPTEAALKVLVEKMGLPRGSDGSFSHPDEILHFSTYNGESHPAHKLLLDPSNYSSIESDLIFVGLAGLRDPPREEVHRAIEDCRAAGIRVMVITGDNKDTAEAICCEIGVFESDEDISRKSFTGKEFMFLSDEDKKFHLRQTGGLLFSRAEPKHKQDIVKLLKEDGEVVAMTGDGVNDAPALKLADIGIAMGIAGTEVAKEASDMVLADDNFSTIVAAVGEGRSIYNNMKAFIRYMISSNIGEVASIFLTAALGIPEGLIPVQLLWVNLVTDGPPATALGFNPPDKDIMKNPPRRSDDSLISAWILFRYLVIGLYVGLATVGVFIIWYTHGSFLGIDLTGDGHTLVTYSQLSKWGQCQTWEGFKVSPFTAGSRVFNFDENPCDYFQTGKVKAMTLSLSVLVSIEMFNSLNALSEDGSLLTMPPWVFGIVPLSLNEWLLVVAVAFPVILIDEVLKFIGRCSNGVRRRRLSKKRKDE
ncbi:Calcium-transporting ATPase 4, endoplasmic reticulum-type [Acorus calamus]|uniref:Calcium-transporting ATPase 4, endoplasmic reticulum-type n=1 Tax=Acorus calamus TaxID=4465 RepID=A0AAV9CAE5_ACOCL|nr:Calcium-transporting ATPase 4, endoplasmic reticulum-type [Acorus calamus]